jgi:HSP20 family protein
MEAFMTLVTYEPWTLVNRLHRQLNQVFNAAAAPVETASAPSVSWVPRVDVYEEAERFVVLADVPGVESKDINITAENGVLTIRGERRAEKKATDKNGYERIERTSGTFLRRFTLPDTANTETITAKQTNGVLEVSIPKHPQVQPRRIAVEAA